MKKFSLRKETLVELTPDALSEVVGGNGSESQSCPITYKCISAGECNITISNRCEITIAVSYCP